MNNSEITQLILWKRKKNAELLRRCKLLKTVGKITQLLNNTIYNKRLEGIYLPKVS